MDWNTFSIYAIYVILLALDIVAGRFSIIPSDVVTATFTLIVGHFLGLQVIPPSIKKTLTLTSTSPLEVTTGITP